MRLSILFIVILGLFMFSPPQIHAVAPMINPPTTGQQLFFDDFTSSGFPVLWNSGLQVGINNATQTGGYLITTVQRGNFIGTAYTTRMIANNTQPVVSSALNKTFLQLSWKMQAFNITNPSILSAAGPGACSGNCGGYPLIADIQFGLSSEAIHGGSGSLPRNSIYFELMSATGPLNLIDANLVNSKTAAYLAVNGGPANAGANFVTDLLVCCPGTNAILYGPGNTVFDFNQMHTYNIQLNLNVSDASQEYVRYQIDNNAWMTFWQTACNCIGTGAVSTLYPFFDLTYLVGRAAGILASPIVASQSLASQMDYLLATNYAPQSLPQGQLLSSNINPPLQNQGIYKPGGFSLTQYVQFQANEIGQGNIYAGGLFLTGIFILIITLGLAGVMWKTRMGFAVFGMIWNISTLAFIYLMYYTGVIPLLIPVLVTIGAAAILFGIFRSGPPSMGGEVKS